MEPEDGVVATVYLWQRQWLLVVAVSGSAREKEKECRGRERENGEGRGKQGSCLAFMHQGEVATGADTGGHTALAVCTVTTLFINFKFPILPQTYH